MLHEYTHSFQAMGTTIHASIVCTEEKHAHTLFTQIKSSITEYEHKFSRFLPESELSTLNKEKSLFVSAEFFEVFTTAIALSRETGGYFNPLLQIAPFGYGSSFDQLSMNDSPHHRKYGNTDITAIISNAETRHILLTENQMLDFGGLLKGLLAERLAKTSMQQGHIHGIILNIGGDLATYGRDADNRPFMFTIYNPITDKEESPMALENTCLATSGSYKRTWKDNGKTVRHILDRTGTQNPASDIISATVIHEKGANAEAYAKMLFSLPNHHVLDFFATRKISYATINTKGIINTHLIS